MRPFKSKFAACVWVRANAWALLSGQSLGLQDPPAQAA
jgi:hypothetical protein